MPLSDNEKRLLAEMEAALVADDPQLVSTLNGSTRHPKSGVVLAGLGAIFGGIAILFAGLISQLTPLGIAGFLVSLVGVVLLISNISGMGSNKMGAKPAKGSKPKWSARLEDRWERRNFDN